VKSETEELYDLSKLMKSCGKFGIKRKLRQNKGLGIGIF
jgi:hypothetical protein